MAAPRRTTPARHPTMPGISSISRKVAARRLELGLTQQTLADLSGVSRSTIQALERGMGGIRLESLIALTDVLGLQVRLASTTDPSNDHAE